MAKNPLGKTRDVENAYATFEANGFEYRIAKTYKLAKNEAGDPMKRRPTWELKNMILALSLHSWLNTKDEDERLKLARQELEERKA